MYFFWTKQKKKFAEENHNLIYSFLNKHNLSIDEYYDVAAIGYCKAVQNFDSSRGVSFSTYAFYCMMNSCRMEIRNSKYLRTIPKDKLVYYQQNITNGKDQEYNLEEILVEDKLCLEDEVTTNLAFKHFLDTIDKRDAEILKLLVKGRTQIEIAEDLNMSQSYVSRLIKNIRKKLEKYLNVT